jgi:hypothetical protein
VPWDHFEEQIPDLLLFEQHRNPNLPTVVG